MPSHDTTASCIRCHAFLLPQVRSSLPNEVTRFMEADSITLCIAHCLADAGVIGLTSVAVLCRTFEAIDCFLFQIGYCFDVSIPFS